MHDVVADVKLIVTSAKEDVVVIVVWMLAALRENFQTDLREIFREG